MQTNRFTKKRQYQNITYKQTTINKSKNHNNGNYNTVSKTIDDKKQHETMEE